PDTQAAAVRRGLALCAEGDAAFARDESLASAPLEELSGAQAAAAERYATAHQADPSAPAPLRALLQTSDRDATLRLLNGAADASGEPIQSALYLLEAALRLGPEDAERYDELLRKAEGALPSLSLIHRLGEQQARARGDAGQLLAWLRARRAQSEDSVETALD